MSTTVVTSAIKNESKITQNYQENIAKAQDPRSHLIESQVIYSQSGGVLKSEVSFTRRADKSVDETVRYATSQAALESTIHESLSSLKNFLSAEKSMDGKLVISVNEFISKCNSLKVDSSLPAKQVFVDKAEILAQSVNHACDQILSKRIETDSDITKAVKDANNAISNIYSLNNQIEALSKSDALRLHDERDKYILEVAELFKIDVRYTEKGAALIGADGVGIVVSTDEYVHLEYNTIISEIRPLAVNDKINPIYLNRYNRYQQKINTIEAVAPREPLTNTGAGHAVNYDKKDQLKGGRIEGLLKLRDDILVTTYQDIQNFAKNICTKINEIHNNGSSWPPRYEIMGSTLIRESDPVTCSGDISFFLLDETGKALEGHSGFLSKSVINVESVPTNYTYGKPTYGELAREISELLSSPSAPRAALGTIYSNLGSGDAIVLNDQYLLNNIQIASRSNIVDGQMYFDFEMQGNSHFGSNVEILEITGPNGTMDAATVHQNLRLDQDTKKRFGAEYKIDGLIGGNQNITVKIRVTGDNGVVQEGSITYVVDTNDVEMINRRIPFNGDNTKLSGSFIGLAPSHNSVAKAQIINENNVPLSYNSGGYGYMKISSGNQDYRIVVQDNAFSQTVGLNNFFNYDAVSGKMEVREDIKVDASKISTGRVAQSEGRIYKTKVGSVPANMNINFVGVPDALSNIKIDNVDFIFSNAPNQGEVQIVAGDLQATLDELVESINIHPSLQNKIYASRSGDQISLLAKVAGTSGNAITAQGNIIGGGTININGAGANNIYAATNFTGGDDISSEVKVYKYLISEKSVEILDDISNINDLHHMASITTSLFANKLNDADKKAKVKLRALEMLDQINKEKNGVMTQEIYVKVMESMSNKKMLTSVLKKQMQIEDEISSIIASAA